VDFVVHNIDNSVWWIFMLSTPNPGQEVVPDKSKKGPQK